MSDQNLLLVKDLSLKLNEQTILDKFNLSIKKGEVHAIMGPNGSGKSSLCHLLAGHKDYKNSGGSVHFLGEDILDKSPEERAALGLFLSFQYPCEIPGLNNAYFLRSAYNALRKARGQNEIDAIDFLALARKFLAKLKMDESFLHRNLNEGFSGGEKKRNEILQMSLFEPSLCLLDETDSGLDIDALKICAEGINEMRSSERGILLVTHYQRLLDYVRPDFVHVMVKGKIVLSGDIALAKDLESNGYAQYL